jgi:hypothetical protein
MLHKSIRVWCRSKYGAEWWSEEKKARVAEASAALGFSIKTPRSPAPAGKATTPRKPPAIPYPRFKGPRGQWLVACWRVCKGDNRFWNRTCVRLEGKRIFTRDYSVTSSYYSDPCTSHATMAPPAPGDKGTEVDLTTHTISVREGKLYISRKGAEPIMCSDKIARGYSDSMYKD